MARSPPLSVGFCSGGILTGKAELDEGVWKEFRFMSGELTLCWSLCHVCVDQYRTPIGPSVQPDLRGVSRRLLRRIDANRIGDMRALISRCLGSLKPFNLQTMSRQAVGIELVDTQEHDTCHNYRKPRRIQVARYDANDKATTAMARQDSTSSTKGSASNI